jgi:hypothetical protein
MLTQDLTSEQAVHLQPVVQAEGSLSVDLVDLSLDDAGPQSNSDCLIAEQVQPAPFLG